MVRSTVEELNDALRPLLPCLSPALKPTVQVYLQPYLGEFSEINQLQVPVESLETLIIFLFRDFVASQNPLCKLCHEGQRAFQEVGAHKH